MRFNEKWTYHHPRHDPAGAVERIVYWRRYDYIGSMIRKTAGGEWEKDESLPAGAGASGPTRRVRPGGVSSAGAPRFSHSHRSRSVDVGGT